MISQKYVLVARESEQSAFFVQKCKWKSPQSQSLLSLCCSDAVSLSKGVIWKIRRVPLTA